MRFAGHPGYKPPNKPNSHALTAYGYNPHSARSTALPWRHNLKGELKQQDHPLGRTKLAEILKKLGYF
jgi:hypothetical protein